MKQTNDFISRVSKLIGASIATKQELKRSAETLSTIANVSGLLASALRQGGKVLLFGNGGSAADAQHIAAELVGRFAFDRPALPALALSENGSSVTAIGNDEGFDQVFARQIEAFGRPGDVAIGISTSGNSVNVIRGMSAARKLGLQTIALTGRKGGNLRNCVDHCVCIPSDETPRIQECHILIGHILSQLVESELFHEEARISGSRRSHRSESS